MGFNTGGVVGVGSLLRERTGVFDTRCIGLLFKGRGITCCIGLLGEDGLRWVFLCGSTCLVFLLGLPSSVDPIVDLLSLIVSENFLVDLNPFNYICRHKLL